MRRLRRASEVVSVVVLIACGSRAAAFVPVCPPGNVQTSARWDAAPHAAASGHSLQDGISVAIEPGLAETLVLASTGAVAPEDVASVRDVIEAAFAGWESPVLAFHVTIDGPAVRGLTVGEEIDVFAVPSDDPEFAASGALAGVTYFDAPFEPDRLLTNGTALAGDAYQGADILLSKDSIAAFSSLFPTRAEKIAALQRLLMHEIGHAIGLGHPNEFPSSNLDTDMDPLNPMPIDPAAPLASLIPSSNIDGDTIMSNLPSHIPLALTTTELRNDERGGRDALYPAPASVICSPIPRSHCRTAAKSKLTVKAGSSPEKNALTWAWTKGAATTFAELGDPLGVRRYGLCVYAGSALLIELIVPPSATRWSAKKSRSLAYADKARTEDGVKKILLTAGDDQKAKASLLADGATLALPPLGGVAMPVTVQLVNHESPLCLERVFGAGDVKTNDTKTLAAKAAD